MAQKFILDDKEYEVDDVNDGMKTILASLQFSDMRIQELSNMKILLQKAKKGYVESLKTEIISRKAGFLFGEN